VPELPEVETVRSALAPVLEGRRLERVRIDDVRVTLPLDPAGVARRLKGERVASVDRRGKYLMLRFESGRVLLVHLRMTGSFRHAADGKLGDDAYRRATAWLDDGSALGYRDVRRFGTWLLLEPDEVEPYLAARLGPEPLDASFTPRALAARLAGRRAPIKAAILDQRTVAGVGNIYADEALWRARIHPLREARSLDPAEIRALQRAVRRALEVGIARQGSTLSDYRQPNGAPGGMQDEFKVYGRAGEPCDRCGTPIERIVVAGRGTSYCPSCQVSPYAEPSTASSRPSRSSRTSSV
jgi:formamidopyrimidine-DNA glycosylase